jgi:hypothetical protein
VLYELMTLRKAFDGSSLPALVLNIVRGSGRITAWSSSTYCLNLSRFVSLKTRYTHHIP